MCELHGCARWTRVRPDIVHCMSRGRRCARVAWHGCAAILNWRLMCELHGCANGHGCDRTRRCTRSEAEHGAGTADVRPEAVH
eukprot:4620379-Alexandrium_andersonii.AAC.1